MSVQDEFYVLQQEVILNDIEEDERAQKQAQKAKELEDLMEGLKKKIDKNEPIFIGGMADESPELQMDYVLEKHLERERHEDFMSEVEAEENAKKKELKNSMTWEERMHYWSLFYPLIYRQKAIEKQIGGNENILRKICFVKGDKQIKPIYESILAKDGGILAQWETLYKEIFDIEVFQLGKEFKVDVYLSLEREIIEAVERDLLKVNIPLLYSFTPSDEEIIDKVYEDSIPF